MFCAHNSVGQPGNNSDVVELEVVSIDVLHHTIH